MSWASSHRDVSPPQNLFPGPMKGFKVVDFGIAKNEGHLNRTQRAWSRTQVRVKMGRECTGQKVDRRTDILRSASSCSSCALRADCSKRATPIETHEAIQKGVPDPCSVSPAGFRGTLAM